MKIKVINRSSHELPAYKTLASAGLDLRAHLEEAITLAPLQRALIPTGIHMELPVGYEATVRSRSGLALKEGLFVLNSPGTIDADYRGDVGVILANLSDISVTVKPGERIAQLVVSKHERIEWEPVEELETSERGAGGFGSTGKQ